MTKVSDVMNPVVVSISPHSEMKELLDVLSIEKSGRVVVTDQGKPVAMVTTRSVVLAYAEYGRELSRLKVKDLMSEDLVKVRLDDELQAVLRLMLNKEIGGVPVMDGDVLVGIFTERELIKFMAKRTYSGLVDSVMSTDLKVIDEHEDTLEASKMMQRYKVRRLPVVSNGRLVGIITAADIVKSLARTLDPRPVLEAGTRNPITVGRYETLMRIVRIMEERRIGTIPIVENEIVGIVTERDLLYATVTSGIS